MDRNVIIAFALSMAVYSLWMVWNENTYGPQRRAAAERARLEQLAAKGVEEPGALGLAAEAPAVEPTPEPIGGGGKITHKGELSAEPSVPNTERIPLWTGKLENDDIVAEFTNRGGTLTSLRLKRYFTTPEELVEIELFDLPPPHALALTTPFRELGFGDLSEEVYEVRRHGSDEIEFVLQRGGVEIRKRYRRDSAGFGLTLEIDVANHTDRIISPEFEVRLPAVVNDTPDFLELSLAVLSGDDVTREVVQTIGSSGFFGKFFGGGDEGPTTVRGEIVWLGVDLKYFAALLIPEQSDRGSVVFEPAEPRRAAVAAFSIDPVEIAPGQVEGRSYTAFMGPKQPELLEGLGHDLERAVNTGYSWIAPLTLFFGSALHFIHRFVPNYGLAIILITLLVRVATWPIMARQMKSAERMRELMPQIKALQEKYKDDRQKQSEETFKLYRETGVNPLGGCLPLVLQMPVFIGLFFALQSSIDLRHAPFFLWINDLSAPATMFTIPGLDFPFRLLPILMGASMFAQQKMMPQTGMDPAQAKMMLIMMPGMMLVISYSFPSGLVLYWMVSNLLGIAHQLYVRKQMQAKEAKA